MDFDLARLVQSHESICVIVKIMSAIFKDFSANGGYGSCGRQHESLYIDIYYENAGGSQNYLNVDCSTSDSCHLISCVITSVYFCHSIGMLFITQCISEIFWSKLMFD